MDKVSLEENNTQSWFYFLVSNELLVQREMHCIYIWEYTYEKIVL